MAPTDEVSSEVVQGQTTVEDEDTLEAAKSEPPQIKLQSILRSQKFNLEFL